MADIINLNKYRKTRTRAAEATKAAENRVRHGRTKAAKTLEATDAARSGRDLDGKRLDAPDDDREPA